MSLELTPVHRQLIADALIAQNKTKRDLARHVKRTDAWVTKLFSGKLKNLRYDLLDEIEEWLAIKLLPYVVETANREFNDLHRTAARDPELRAVLHYLAQGSMGALRHMLASDYIKLGESLDGQKDAEQRGRAAVEWLRLWALSRY